METSGQHLHISARLPRNGASEDPIALTCIRRESGERHDGFVRVILDGDWLVCGDAREDEEG